MTTNWKIVRVFISSTFRDMQAERDHLVRFVFPRLREQLLPRRIHLVDVDLRWGVTSEEDASEACREIINECRPRFLCMLGGRYGWVPPGKTRSITADEVHYGVLDRTLADRDFAYFYFRDDTATAAMMETTPGEFREPQGSDNQNRFAEFKHAVIAAGLNPFTYPAQWDNESKRLTGLKTFGDCVYDDLLSSIKSDPDLRNPFVTDIAAQPDEFAEENAAMETFVEERGQRFVLGSRETALNELLTHANTTGGNSYFCLTGPPGSGKSALLAHLRQHPTLDDQISTLLICHFAGASPGSTDVRRTLRRLCYELKMGCPDITVDIPDDPEKLLVAFRDFLRQACAQKRVVILLDAVNQFDSASHSTGLHFLPEELPANVRIILSALDGPALEELRRRPRKPCEIELKPLTAADGEAIIEQFRERYQKKFEPNQRAALLAKTDACTPLYLSAALEELRTLGTYEEITERIAELPSTTQELFVWILERLENDDGFRNTSRRRVGHELVPHFAALMGASRYGLSQHELADLLDAGDPQGNVAALLHLLRPYLMRRGNLLDFYHGQFRETAEKAYLQTDALRLAAHQHLADYFRRKADPERNQNWETNARQLAELPFHLARGGRAAELRGLFSQLSYLSARVAAGQVYEQVTDFSLAGSPLTSALMEWHDFLQKHAQRLTQHPKMLVALAQHEGFAEARTQAVTVPWRHSWLRTLPETMPVSEAPIWEGLRVEVTGHLEFPRGRTAVLAPQQAVVFSVERLGVLRVSDARAMRQTEVVLPIRRERPLVLACAPDATGLAIFYESGRGELYRSIFGREEWPEKLELAVEFRFHLPECENPVVAWHDGECWFQARAASLGRVSTQDRQVAEEPFPVGESGELSALVFGEGFRLVALRQGCDTSLLTPGTPPLRKPGAEVIAASACGRQKVAVAFSDGDLVVYEIGAVLTAKTKVRTGMLRGSLGWDGARLLWVAERQGFYAWRPEESLPLPVQENQEMFPIDLHLLPRQWHCRPDGTMLLITTHSIIAFRLLQGGAGTDGRLEDFFGGFVWRAVCKRGRDQWLLEGGPLREVLLGRGVMGRLYCAPDGKGQFFAASGYGPGLVLDLATLQPTPLQDCPPGLNVAVGEESGGCWLTDRAGDIYFADRTGHCRPAVKIGLPDITGAQLKSCGDYLVWVGYSSRYFPKTGAEPARTFVFFKKIRRHPPMIERLGEQFRHPSEGLCVAVCYDKSAEQLVTLWVKAAEEGETYYLRVGPVKEFCRWQFREVNVLGLGPYRFVQADLSADGRLLGIVNMAGEFSCLSIGDGRVLATLAGSAPFTAVVPGADGPKFWLVEARTLVYGCSLVEKKE